MFMGPRGMMMGGNPGPAQSRYSFAGTQGGGNNSSSPISAAPFDPNRPMLAGTPATTESAPLQPAALPTEPMVGPAITAPQVGNDGGPTQTAPTGLIAPAPVPAGPSLATTPQPLGSPSHQTQIAQALMGNGGNLGSPMAAQPGMRLGSPLPPDTSDPGATAMYRNDQSQWNGGAAIPYNPSTGFIDPNVSKQLDFGSARITPQSYAKVLAAQNGTGSLLGGPAPWQAGA